MNVAITIMISVLAAAIGIAGSWLAAWYYHMKSRPERTSVLAMVSAVQKEIQASGSSNVSKRHYRFPLKWVLELIQTYEEGRIYLPELLVCAKMFEDVAQLLHSPLKAADRAGTEAGPTLSPAWHEARRKALREKLAEVKADIRSKLQENRR